MQRSLSAAIFAALLAGSCSMPEEPAPSASSGQAAGAPAAGVYLAAGTAEEAAPEEAEVEEAAEPVVRSDPDPRAAAAVKAMADALRKAGTFSVRIESWSDDPTAEGGFVSVPTQGSITVRRPDGVFGERRSDRGRRKFWYDGKSFSALDVDRGMHATVEAPPTLEGTVDMLKERFGLVLPLADLLVDDPADSYTKHADAIDYHGIHPVAGVPCHHLGFSSSWLAWQIWIAAEGDAVPRRVQITYLDEPGDPRYVAELSDWKLGVPVAASDFAFVPPAGSTAVVLAPIAATSEAAPAAPAEGGR